MAGGGSETMYTFFGRGRVKSHVHILEGGVHILGRGKSQKQCTHSLAGGGLKAMYTFRREVMYTFIGRGRVKSNVHILEGSDVHIHCQGEG